jgi:hypothetical protein
LYISRGHGWVQQLPGALGTQCLLPRHKGSGKSWGIMDAVHLCTAGVKRRACPKFRLGSTLHGGSCHSCCGDYARVQLTLPNSYAQRPPCGVVPCVEPCGCASNVSRSVRCALHYIHRLKAGCSRPAWGLGTLMCWLFDPSVLGQCVGVLPSGYTPLHPPHLCLPCFSPHRRPCHNYCRPFHELAAAMCTPKASNSSCSPPPHPTPHTRCRRPCIHITSCCSMRVVLAFKLQTPAAPPPPFPTHTACC